VLDCRRLDHAKVVRDRMMIADRLFPVTVCRHKDTVPPASGSDRPSEAILYTRPSAVCEIWSGHDQRTPEPKPLGAKRRRVFCAGSMTVWGNLLPRWGIGGRPPLKTEVFVEVNPAAALVRRRQLAQPSGSRSSAAQWYLGDGKGGVRRADVVAVRPWIAGACGAHRQCSWPLNQSTVNPSGCFC
jgi:hypothetical protein